MCINDSFYVKNRKTIKSGSGVRMRTLTFLSLEDNRKEKQHIFCKLQKKNM